MFSKTLTKLIKRKKISQSSLARDLNIHRQRVYDWKSGKSKPTHEDLIKLAQYFGVSVDYLLKSDEETGIENFGDGNIVASNNASIKNSNNTNNHLSQQEQELLRLFRQLPVKDQVQLLSNLYQKEENTHSNPKRPPDREQKN